MNSAASVLLEAMLSGERRNRDIVIDRAIRSDIILSGGVIHRKENPVIPMHIKNTITVLQKKNSSVSTNPASV